MASSQFAGIYRDREEMAKRRLADLFHRAQASSKTATNSKAAAIYRRRLARSWAGVVGIVTGVAMLVAAIIAVALDAETLAPPFLLIALGSTFFTYVLVRATASMGLDSKMRAILHLSQDTERDLERLERISPQRYVEGAARALGPMSLWTPMAAAALIGPLTLHVGVWLVFSYASAEIAVDGLGWWMGASGMLVGHAHLVLAFLSYRYVKRLYAGTAKTVTHEGFRALGWTTFAAMIPGALLIMLPPTLVCVTGVVLIVPMFYWAHRTGAREHATLTAVC